MKYLVLVLLLFGCVAQQNVYKADVLNSTMQLKLPFGHMEYIQSKYTCEGEDVSPRIEISGVPEGTKSLAVIVDDPDAPVGVFVHWVVWNLRVGNIEEGTSDGTVGTNDFGRLGYNGPCPPPGKPHRYFFKVYALDTMLELEEGATKQELLNAMEGHILDKAEYIGLYKR